MQEHPCLVISVKKKQLKQWQKFLALLAIPDTILVKQQSTKLILNNFLLQYTFAFHYACYLFISYCLSINTKLLATCLKFKQKIAINSRSVTERALSCSLSHAQLNYKLSVQFVSFLEHIFLYVIHSYVYLVIFLIRQTGSYPKVANKGFNNNNNKFLQ